MPERPYLQPTPTAEEGVSYDGAGLLCEGDGRVVARGSSFVRNVAGPLSVRGQAHCGGALLVTERCHLDAYDAVFEGNEAIFGAAVCAAMHANLTFVSSTFRGNMAMAVATSKLSTG